MSTAGRITNSIGGRKSFKLSLDATLSHADVEGATQRLGAHVYINGIAVVGMEGFGDVEANGRQQVSVSGVLELKLDDYVECWVSNQESTANVTIQALTMTLTQA